VGRRLVLDVVKREFGVPAGFRNPVFESVASRIID
jgi:hypothetical protein